MCLGTTKNVSCVPSVHPIAPIGPTIEANIIDQIPLFFRHPVFNIQIKIRCFVAKLSELYLRTLVDKININKKSSWTLYIFLNPGAEGGDAGGAEKGGEGGLVEEGGAEGGDAGGADPAEEIGEGGLGEEGGAEGGDAGGAEPAEEGGEGGLGEEGGAEGGDAGGAEPAEEGGDGGWGGGGRSHRRTGGSSCGGR